MRVYHMGRHRSTVSLVNARREHAADLRLVLAVYLGEGRVCMRFMDHGRASDTD